MKKFGFLTPFIVAMVMVICFVQCQKERPLGFKITCYYEGTEDPIDDSLNGYFYIDTSKYLLFDSLDSRYNYCDTTLAAIHEKINKGIAEFKKLQYPALLRVVLASDTFYNVDSTSHWVYRDTIEVKVNEDNVVNQKNPDDDNPAKAKAYLKKILIAQ